jgi:hypothetical protein
VVIVLIVIALTKSVSFRRSHLARTVRKQHEDAGHQDKDDDIIEVGQQASRTQA